MLAIKLNIIFSILLIAVASVSCTPLEYTAAIQAMPPGASYTTLSENQIPRASSFNSSKCIFSHSFRSEANRIVCVFGNQCDEKSHLVVYTWNRYSQSGHKINPQK
ncbi:unnamed protein product, partial [Leptidea sinapis]